MAAKKTQKYYVWKIITNLSLIKSVDKDQTDEVNNHNYNAIALKLATAPMPLSQMLDEVHSKLVSQQEFKDIGIAIKSIDSPIEMTQHQLYKSMNDNSDCLLVYTDSTYFETKQVAKLNALTLFKVNSLARCICNKINDQYEQLKPLGGHEITDIQAKEHPELIKAVFKRIEIGIIGEYSVNGFF